MILTVHLTASFPISDICIPVLHGRIQCDRLRHFKTKGKTNLWKFAWFLLITQKNCLLLKQMLMLYLYATLVEATILLSVGFPEPLGSDLEWRIRIQINNSGSGFGSTSDQWCRQKSVLSSCSWMLFDKINLPSLLSFSAYFRGFKVVMTKFI